MTRPSPELTKAFRGLGLHQDEVVSGDLRRIHGGPSILPGHEDAVDPDPYADSRALGALVADVRYALSAIQAGDREEAQEVLERALARHPEIDEELGRADPT